MTTTVGAVPGTGGRAGESSGGPRTVDTWLGGGAVLATVHTPASAATTGVVICPPLGYEYAVAYRTLRHLADRIAETAALPVVRFDYPGLGDSTADLAPDSFEAGPRLAAEALRRAGCTGVVYLGLGSGALVAAAAAARDPESRGLALWDPAASGRQWLRRQRSLYAIEVGPDAEQAPDGVVMIAGAELPVAVAARIAALDYDPTVAARLPTLLAVREGPSGTVPKALRTVADRLDLVEVPGHEDSLDMSSITASIPAQSVASVTAWFAARFGAGEGDGPSGVQFTAPDPEDRVTFVHDGLPLEERLVRVGPHRLFAVETRPAAGPDDLPVVILHNGSAEHRVGASRHQVELARRLATRGVRALRVDRRGTGESGPVTPDEPSLLFTREWLEDGRDVVAGLGLPRERIGIAGMCVGGWVGLVGTPDSVAFVAALSLNDHRVRPQEPRPTGVIVPVAPTDAAPVGRADRLVALAKRRLPYRILLAAASRGRIRFAEPNLRRALAAGTDVLVLIGPEDVAVFEEHGGRKAMERLRGLPGTLTMVERPTGDHALYSPAIRRAAIDETVALAERAFGIGADDRR